MRKYRQSAGTVTRVGYGVELTAGLQSFPETQGLAPVFEALNDALDASYFARLGKQKVLVIRRAEMRFASYEAHRAIRMFARAVEIADGGRRGGPLSRAIFPEGVGPVLADGATRQLRLAGSLVGRLKKSKVPGAAALATEWAPKLDAALASLKKCASEHQAAKDVYEETFLAEKTLRSEHRTHVDKLAGEVRAAFPDDPTKQDVVFPVFEESESAESAEDADDAKDAKDAKDAENAEDADDAEDAEDADDADEEGEEVKTKSKGEAEAKPKGEARAKPKAKAKATEEDEAPASAAA